MSYGTDARGFFGNAAGFNDWMPVLVFLKKSKISIPFAILPIKTKYAIF